MSCFEDIVVNAAAEAFGATKEEILSNQRESHLISDARYSAIYYLALTGKTKACIATHFNRDRSNVSHAARVVPANIATNQAFRERFDRMRQIINETVPTPS